MIGNSTGAPTEEDWRILVQKARDLEHRIHQVEGKQNDYNQVLERCYVVEEKQRLQMQELRDRIREEEIDSLTNPDFSRWMKKQPETMATEEDVLHTWFNYSSLSSLTPFAAMAPFPRYLTEKGTALLESTVDQLGLSPLYVLTVPVKASTAAITQALVPRATHVLPPENMSKSSLGPMAFLSTPLKSGAEVTRLIESTPVLKEGLADTNCLFLSDRRLTPSLVFKALVVRGRCTVAEVGCPSSFLHIFKNSNNAETSGSSSFTPFDVIAYALGAYVKNALTSTLKARTYEAVLIADFPTGDSQIAAGNLNALQMSDIRFQLLNIDYPDNSHFDMFDADDLRSISAYISRRDQHSRGLVELPPALRAVEGGGSPPLVATVAMAIRQLERSADRFKAYCGEKGVHTICSSFVEEAAASSEGVETAVLQDGARLSAAHMDPFMNLSMKPTEGYGHLVKESRNFFSVDSV